MMFIIGGRKRLQDQASCVESKLVIKGRLLDNLLPVGVLNLPDTIL
jgi:hypothetical protein